MRCTTIKWLENKKKEDSTQQALCQAIKQAQNRHIGKLILNYGHIKDTYAKIKVHEMANRHTHTRTFGCCLPFEKRR